MKTKKINLAILLLITGMTFSTFVACAQKLSGNGNVVTKERNITPFTQLEIKGVFNVFLNQGEKETVKVETDENLQDIVEAVNEGSTLTVQLKKGESYKKSTKMNVYVTLKDLTKLDINGVGNVESTLLTLADLRLDVSGVGNSSLELKCKSLDADITGVGNIKLKGSSDEAKLNVSGTGNLKAFDFHVKKLTADVSGVGSTDLCAEEEISISSSGIGSVSYTGAAVVKKIHSTGIGKVKKV